MDKKLSKLELVKMEIEVAERKTNQKIKELGMQDQSLYHGFNNNSEFV